jgi:nicotinamide riboside kinase
VLICDTDTLTTLVWSRLLYDRVDPLIKASASVACYHLTLVCMPDMPYVPDVHRVDPDTRQDFLDLLLDELRAQDVEPVLLTGDIATREQTAAAAIEALIATQATAAPGCSKTRSKQG